MLYLSSAPLTCRTKTNKQTNRNEWSKADQVCVVRLIPGVKSLLFLEYVPKILNVELLSCCALRVINYSKQSACRSKVNVTDSQTFYWSCIHLASCYIFIVPKPVCPANREEFTDKSKSTAMVVWKDPSVKDVNGNDVVVTCVPPSGSEFRMGKREVACTAGGGDIEHSTCTFTVTIKGTYLLYFPTFMVIRRIIILV